MIRACCGRGDSRAPTERARALLYGGRRLRRDGERAPELLERVQHTVADLVRVRQEIGAGENADVQPIDVAPRRHVDADALDERADGVERVQASLAPVEALPRSRH